MGLFDSYFLRRDIDRWREDMSLAAVVVLNQLATDLIDEVEKDLKMAGWKDGLVGQDGFIHEKIAPKLRAQAEPVIQELVDLANRSLRILVEHQILWARQSSPSPGREGALAGMQDIALAAGPLAGGGVLAAALPAMAITTTASWFGLVSATTISWPVVVVGGAIAGIALATGAVNTSKIWDRTEGRLRERIRSYIVAYLLEGTAKDPSVLEQLKIQFIQTAEQAKKA